MLTQSDIDDLRIKLLPPGANHIIEEIDRHRERVHVTRQMIENVPIIVITRPSIMARLPINGSLQKLTRIEQILTTLQGFLTGRDSLYLYINLPELGIPLPVSQLLAEVSNIVAAREKLKELIDEALDRRDREAFMELSLRLERLEDTIRE